MSAIEVRQIGHVASAPSIDTFTVSGHPQTKATVIVISNARWKGRDGKVQEKATAVTWTMWGSTALNAGQYLRVSSKVAVAGSMESRRYTNKEGKEVFGFDFTARTVEYLESRASAEARANRTNDNTRDNNRTAGATPSVNRSRSARV